MTRNHYSGCRAGLPLTTQNKKTTQTKKFFQTLPPAFWPHTHMHIYTWRVWVWDPSLVHSSSAARRGGTWYLDPDNFFLRDFSSWIFCLGIGPCGPVPPPPQEWNSILPLVTATLITPKGAEPPGSRRIGVIGALVLILPSETL